MFDETFDKVLRTINTIKHPGQAETVYNLIEQFRKVRKNDSLADTLREYLIKKVSDFPVINEERRIANKGEVNIAPQAVA